jgi:hypothetical protein
VKPYLRHQRQFELIPAYGMLPLRQVGLIGGLLPALSSTAALQVFAGLASGSAKVVVKVARVFADTVLAEQHLSEEYLAATQEFRIGLGAIDDAVAGYALDRLLTTYHDVIPSFVTDEDAAVEIVRRLAPKTGVDLWEVFRDPQRMANVRFCPLEVAQALGPTAALVHDAVSSNFSNAKNPRALGLILTEIAKDIGQDAFNRSICGLEHAKFWDGVVQNINRADTLESAADLTLPKSSAAMHSITAGALREIQTIIRRPAPAKAA